LTYKNLPKIVQLHEFLRIKQKDTPRGQTTNQSIFIRQWEAHFIGCP